MTVVLFDLDGTLTDSAEGVLRSTRHAFERLGETQGERFDLPTDSELGWIIGPPLRDSFAKLGGAGNVETLMGFYLERYRDIGAFENSVYDGVPEALDALRAAGARLFVATSKNQGDAERILVHFGLADRFEAIHGARGDGALADKTELIANLLTTHALSPKDEDIAMVGDRKFDVVGARNCGLKAIGALWGYGGAAELEEAGADAIADRPGDVEPLSRRLFAKV
jgi:phosphoglycolate phosphatase